jgi:hypothetical protein
MQGDRPHAKDVELVLILGVDAHVDGQRLARPDARTRDIPLDFGAYVPALGVRLVRVTRDLRKDPVRRAWLLILG